MIRDIAGGEHAFHAVDGGVSLASALNFQIAVRYVQLIVEYLAVGVVADGDENDVYVEFLVT